MKCKTKGCNNKLSRSTKHRKGFTGLCQKCYTTSPLIKRPKGPQSTEARRILKTLATQNRPPTLFKRCKQCNRKLCNRNSPKQPGYTGLCQQCYLHSTLNKGTQPCSPKDHEPQTILKTLATQQQETNQ